MNSPLLVMMFSDSRRSFFVEDIFIDEQSKALACMSGCEAILLWIWLITAKSNAESPVFSRYCRSDASKGANGYINGSSTHSESVSGIVRNTDKKNAARSRTSSSLSYRQRWRSVKTRARRATEQEPKFASAQTAEARIVAFSRMTRL